MATDLDRREWQRLRNLELFKSQQPDRGQWSSRALIATSVDLAPLQHGQRQQMRYASMPAHAATQRTTSIFRAPGHAPAGQSAVRPQSHSYPTTLADIGRAVPPRFSYSYSGQSIHGRPPSQPSVVRPVASSRPTLAPDESYAKVTFKPSLRAQGPMPAPTQPADQVLPPQQPVKAQTWSSSGPIAPLPTRVPVKRTDSRTWKPLHSEQRAGLAHAVRSVSNPTLRDIQLFVKRYLRDEPEFRPGAFASHRRVNDDGSWRDSLSDSRPAITPVRVVRQTAHFKDGIQLGRVLAYRKYGVETCRQPATRFEVWDIELGEIAEVSSFHSSNALFHRPDSAELRQPYGPGVFKPSVQRPSEPAQPVKVRDYAQPRPAAAPPIVQPRVHASTSPPKLAPRKQSADGQISAAQDLIAMAISERTAQEAAANARSQATHAQPKLSSQSKAQSSRAKRQLSATGEIPVIADPSLRKTAPPALQLERSNHRFLSGGQSLSPLVALSPNSNSPETWSAEPFTPGRRYAKRKASEVDISGLLEDYELIRHMRKRRAQFLTSSVRHAGPKTPLKTAFRIVKRSPRKTPTSARFPPLTPKTAPSLLNREVQRLKEDEISEADAEGEDEVMLDTEDKALLA